MKRSLCLCLCLALGPVGAAAQTSSIAGSIRYAGAATGTVFVLAATNLDESDLEFEWSAAVAGPFTNAYVLTNLPAASYYVVATLETNDLTGPECPWGHYAFWSNAPETVAVPAGTAVSNVDFPLVDGSVSNNPYASGDDEPPTARVCDGTPFTCMPASQGWTLEDGRRIEDEYFFDSWIVPLADGTWRLYANSSAQILSNTPAFDSYRAGDGLAFTNEPGHRFEETGAFMPCVLPVSGEVFRCYYTDQSSRPNCGDGEECAGRAIKSAISTNGGLDFAAEGDGLVCDTNLPHEFKGVRGARVLRLADGSYRMYYHAIDSNSVWRILSASSSNGLAWTRDAGVRIDPTDYCPESTSVRNFAPVLPFAGGAIHLFITMSRCGAGWTDLQSGIYDATSSNGLDFVVADQPIVENYYVEASYAGQPTDPQAMPQDPTAIATTNGVRLYFGIYDGPNVLANTSGIYSAICPDWDGDRMPDAAEYAAGTDPNDPESLLDIVQGTRVLEPADAFTVEWQSVSGKTYRLQRSTNLLEGVFENVATNLAAWSNLNAVSDLTASNPGLYFYRIRLEDAE